MRIKISLLAVLFVLTTSWVMGAFVTDDSNLFMANNPDGKKYEFVKNYLSSLSYFQLNDERERKQAGEAVGILDSPEKTEELVKSIIQQNANLRVARNLIKKYKSPENGLILKAVVLFMQVADEQIEFNNEERAMLERVVDVIKSGDIRVYDTPKFYKDQAKIAKQRKESFKKLLESSVLVSKILISNKPDKYGEFINLGITKDERKKLISKLNELFVGYKEVGLKEGQSFLEGSVASIREILEDKSWGTLGS